MKICTNCEKKNVDEALFCVICGTNLENTQIDIINLEDLIKRRNEYIFDILKKYQSLNFFRSLLSNAPIILFFILLISVSSVLYGNSSILRILQKNSLSIILMEAIVISISIWFIQKYFKSQTVLKISEILIKNPQIKIRAKIERESEGGGLLPGSIIVGMINKTDVLYLKINNVEISIKIKKLNLDNKTCLSILNQKLN